MNVVHFKTAADFRQWLEANHGNATELWVGFYKKDSGKRGITYSEALDEALCFGWIDGIKKRVDDLSYTHRFTPRRSNSKWSLINIRRAKDLIKRSRMTPTGLKAFQAHDQAAAERNSHERHHCQLSPPYERALKGNKKAWEFIRAQRPSFQKLARWWVMSAKTEETRWKRLHRLIEESAAGQSFSKMVKTSKVSHG